MASFSMYLCASASVMPRRSMSSHLARFTRRISSIFSSTVAWRSSMRRSRSRVAQSTRKDCRTNCSGAGFETVRTPYSVTLVQTSS